MSKLMLFVLFAISWLSVTIGFSPFATFHVRTYSSSTRFMSTDGNSRIEQLRESKMNVDELKAELDVRGVDYSDCISKNELVTRLVESRATGRVANPDALFDKLNDAININNNNNNNVDSSSSSSSGSGSSSNNSNKNTNEVLDSEALNEAVAGDGALPGGLDPALMKKLSSDPEIVNFLRDPLMLEILKATMQEGPDAVKRYMSNPQAIILLDKLGKAMARAQK